MVCAAKLVPFGPLAPVTCDLLQLEVRQSTCALLFLCSHLEDHTQSNVVCAVCTTNCHFSVAKLSKGGFPLGFIWSCI